MDTAEKNSGRHKSGHRYEETLKLFASYLFVMGGRSVYETIEKNLPGSLPSSATVGRCLRDFNESVLEGEFRFEQLRQYLEEKSLPKVVWISEDGTRVTGKIQYDTRNNQISGFSLPFNNHGVPICGSFPAESSEQIQDYFASNTIANYAYVIMAQPLHEGVAAFCLSFFGSDNRFKADQVLQRWQWMKEQAELQGIKILGFSSDGDTRLLKSMKFESLSKSPLVPQIWQPFFIQALVQEEMYVQDTIHILTKLRTRFLNKKIELKIGNHIASPADLLQLINNEGKQEHCLCSSDLDASDKMNFKAAEKICAPKVITLLYNIPSSEATIFYLELMQNIMVSYLDENISPIQRVYLIWKSVFLLRIWRQWLVKSKHSVTKNFITSNCYTCIELNAHAIVAAINFCKQNNCPDLFLPWLFSSQPCEKFFRAARSMTSTFATVVNFSILEFAGRINRIFFQSQVTQVLNEKYVFPRIEKKNENS